MSYIYDAVTRNNGPIPPQKGTEMTEKYNGWTNRETWLANLWISNDEGLYTEPERIAMECAERVRNGEGNPYIKTFEGKVRAEFVGSLQSWAEEVFLADAPTTGLVADLLSTAWDRIDWHDLARHYLADVDLTEGDEDEV